MNSIKFLHFIRWKKEFIYEENFGNFKIIFGDLFYEFGLNRFGRNKEILEYERFNEKIIKLRNFEDFFEE